MKKLLISSKVLATFSFANTSLSHSNNFFSKYFSLVESFLSKRSLVRLLWIMALGSNVSNVFYWFLFLCFRLYMYCCLCSSFMHFSILCFYFMSVCFLCVFVCLLCVWDYTCSPLRGQHNVTKRHLFTHQDNFIFL